MLAAGIGLPHPGFDEYMLYLGDRPDAKIIARLTAGGAAVEVEVAGLAEILTFGGQ